MNMYGFCDNKTVIPAAQRQHVTWFTSVLKQGHRVHAKIHYNLKECNNLLHQQINITIGSGDVFGRIEWVKLDHIVPLKGDGVIPRMNLS